MIRMMLKVPPAIRIFLATVWTAMILTLCLLPSRWLPAEESKKVAIPNLDKVIHAGLFGVFGLLWTWVGRSPARARAVVIGGFIVAVVSELGQGIEFIARDPDLMDGLADVAGLLIGVGFARVLWNLASPRASAEP
jgi:hypothetical protein